MKNTNYTTYGRTALVTGATAGLGFEASALLIEKYGFNHVIITGRTQEKADITKQLLIERTGKDAYSTLVLDTGEISKAQYAASELVARGQKIDYLLLNAGLARDQFETNSDGYDLVWAATLIGHHVLTIELLNSKILTKDSRIVIAGSEAARADLSGPFSSEFPDYYRIADSSYNGNLTEAILANARGELFDQHNSYHFMNSYGAAKGVVAWWAAALARRLPDTIGVYAVSPGSVPNTSMVRNAPWIMRKVMVPIMAKIGRFFGIAQSINDGASRYVDIIFEDLKSSTGGFYASAPGKMIGAMERQQNDHLTDIDLQEAGWYALVEITGYHLKNPISAMH